MFSPHDFDKKFGTAKRNVSPFVPKLFFRRNCDEYISQYFLTSILFAIMSYFIGMLQALNVDLSCRFAFSTAG